jgi:ankyrin repeat protein
MLQMTIVSLLLVFIIAVPAAAQTPQEAVEELSARGLFYSADALIASAKANDLRSVDLFMAAGLDPDVADPGKAPAIIHAAQEGNTLIVETLLEYGANVNAIDPQNRKTSLLYALENERTDTALLLLKYRADPDVRGPGGLTPLMLAARNGDEELVRILLESGADIEAQADNGSTAFIFAANAGHDNVTRMLQMWYAALHPSPVIRPPFSDGDAYDGLPLSILTR